MFKDVHSKDKLPVGALEEKLPKLAEEHMKMAKDKVHSERNELKKEIK